MDLSSLKSKILKQKDALKSQVVNGIIVKPKEEVEITVPKVIVDPQKSIMEELIKAQDDEIKVNDVKQVIQKKTTNTIKETREWKNSFDIKIYYDALEKELSRQKEIIIRNDMGDVLELEKSDHKIDEEGFSITNITFSFKCEEIFIWIMYCYSIWKNEIVSLNAKETNNLEARKRIGIYLQSKKYLKPLLKSLEKRDTPEQVVNKLFDTMIYCLNKDYIKANQRYYELAIGTSPWPKGEQKFSIHNRYVDRIRKPTDIAYIMNNEVTRKYLLGIKRLITMSQRVFPNKAYLNVSS